jgi:predicted pyridoxine 5'-phosphate oxidase superfamily flavin-nucleotide-binding protein
VTATTSNAETTETKTIGREATTNANMDSTSNEKSYRGASTNYNSNNINNNNNNRVGAFHVPGPTIRTTTTIRASSDPSPSLGLTMDGRRAASTAVVAGEDLFRVRYLSMPLPLS